MKPRLLLVCHVPPPVHGASLVGQFVTTSEAIRSAFKVETIPIQQRSADLAKLQKFSGGKVVGSVLIMGKVANALFRRRPSLVYFTPSIAGYAFVRDLLLASLVKLAGVPIVYHLHMRGVQMRYKRTFSYRVAYRWMFRNSDVIHPSERMFSDVACVVSRERFHVVENGIADPGSAQYEKRPDETQEPRILFLSNLYVDKGPLDLLHASQRLARSGVRHRLTFAGAAADPEVETEIIAAQNDPARHVEWLGGVYGDEKFVLISTATLFAFPSYYRFEVQPLSVIEAMALSVPVVASSIASLPDMITEGVEGLLVEPRDVDGLTDALRRLLQDSELRSRMSLAARMRYLDKFTMDAFEARLLDKLQMLVARKAGTKRNG